MRKLYWALILSIFIHLLLGVSFVFIPTLLPKKSNVVEFEIKSAQPGPSQNKTKQIVREALVPDKMKAPDSEDPLKFWSAQTQRVKKQTRAAQIGMTENHFSHATQKESQQQKKQRSRAIPDPQSDDQSLSRETTGSGMPILGSPGTSRIGESLPQDVQIGSFTALNTDRYLFYSFYSRVEELIRYRWETSVQNALSVIPRERLEANIRGRWTTQLEVILNPKGEFVKVLVMKEAGVAHFDQAAIRAFMDARYFPNPPKEMIEDDGLIHLKYAFTVYFDSHSVARP